MNSVIIFGASGSIGQALSESFNAQGDRVICVSRTETSAHDLTNWVAWGPDTGIFIDNLRRVTPDNQVSKVVWAQGVNFNDEILDFDLARHLKMYEANVTFILSSLHALLQGGLLADGARLCVVSSIWQQIARQKKLSYCITKSALQGLVQSVSIDLGARGILINAVLPGPLDTAMTRANLDQDQISRLELSTPLQSLPNLSDVTGLVSYLCSEKNTGITGQFIAADRGFCHARIL
jgi:3-oxoacyl-[acyl-carrier protein] reductase